MAIDRMDWHYGAEGFPQELDQRAGGTHIGIFLAWVIHNDLIGEFHMMRSVGSIEAVKARKMSGTEFLERECDEKFWNEDLNDTGNEFAKYYYESGKYFEDYASVLAENLPTLYHVQDTWENYEKVSPAITKQFVSWQNSKVKHE